MTKKYIYLFLNKLLFLRTLFAKNKKLNWENIKSICIIWPLCLGDSIMQFPFLFEFLKKYNNKCFTIITDKNQISSYLIDEVKKYHNLQINHIKTSQSFRGLYFFLKGKKFDLLISPFGYTLNNIVPIFCSKFKYFLIFYSLNKNFTSFMVKSNIKNIHIEEKICINDPRDMFLSVLNILDYNLYQELKLKKYNGNFYKYSNYFQLDGRIHIPKEYIVIHCRGIQDERKIKLSRWIEIASSELKERKNHPTIVCVGTFRDKEYTQSFVKQLILKFPNLNIINKFNLPYRELIFLLQKAEILIASDGGIMHLGVLAGTKKIIGIFKGKILPVYRLPKKYLTTALYYKEN